MKAIVTVLGRDRVGIIASVCALLSEYNINILDISQTILEQGYFTMVLLVVCTVVQTTPGLFQFGAAKPLWLLPLGLAVSALEGEFAGAIFGAVCGLMWDYTAGRTVGMLALEMMILCFGVSVIVQLYLKDTPSNFVLLAVGGALLVLAADWLFFYYMPGYAGAAERFLWAVLPSALLTAPGSWLLHRAVQRISAEFKIDNGVV